MYRVPGQGDAAVPGGDGEALHPVGVVHRGVGDDVLEELDLGDGGEARLVGGGGDLDGDLFHRHLAAQVDGDHPLALHLPDGVHPRRGRGVKREGEGGAVRQLHQCRALLHAALAHAVGAGDADLAQLHAPAAVQGDGKLDGFAGGHDGDGAAVPEQVGGVALEQAVGHVHVGGEDGGSVQHLGLPGGVPGVVDVGQVGDIYLAVPVEVVGAGLGGLAQPRVQGGEVAAVHRAVPVHVAQGEGGVPGARDDVLAVAVQGDGLAEGLIARSGEGQVVPGASGGQAGQLHLVVAHPALVGEDHAVGIFRRGGDGRAQAVFQGQPAGQGDPGGAPGAPHLQLDVPARSVGGGLGQVEPEGEADGAGGCPGVRGVGGGESPGQQRQGQDQAQRPGGQSLPRFHKCHPF